MSFDHQFLKDYDRRRFASNTPSPWDGFQGVLTPQAFDQLEADFPSLSQFESHQGVARAHGQRPHDRYYLALEQSIYGTPLDAGKGCVGIDELKPSWREFIDNIRNDATYQNFVRELLGVEQTVIRFAWHLASSGCDVSPHVDAPHKYGTHIFYFNSDENWNDNWGGQTLMLGAKKTDRQNPEITDFDSRAAAPILNNRSMLFKNVPDAWHGVAPIRCPEGNYRRIFNVIFQNPLELEKPTDKPGLMRRVLNRFK